MKKRATRLVDDSFSGRGDRTRLCVAHPISLTTQAFGFGTRLRTNFAKNLPQATF